MRQWIEYTLDLKKKNFKSRFAYSNFLLKKNKLASTHNFNFDNLKKNKLFFCLYNYFKNKIKNQSLFLCSGYGYYEYFLKKKNKKFFISDNLKIYKKFNQENNLSNFLMIDVLKLSDFKKVKFKPKNIILNNVEYLLDDEQLVKCLKNIYLFSTKTCNIYLIFRSCHYSFLNFFDKILLPFEIYLKKIIFILGGKYMYINCNLHGFRRTQIEMEDMIKKNFKIINLYKDLFNIDYERSIIIKKLKISKVIEQIFNRRHPYLYIYKLRKI